MFQPRTGPSGRSGLGAVHCTAQKHTEAPMVAASRLSSFQSQTRSRTVIARPSGNLTRLRSQLRFPLPARIALQGGERAGTDANVPCPPQEESDSGNLSGRPNSPGPGNHPSKLSIPGLPTPLLAFAHDKRRSCEPLEDSRKTADTSILGLKSAAVHSVRELRDIFERARRITRTTANEGIAPAINHGMRKTNSHAL